MKGTVILSTNDNPDYYKYLPYTVAAWNKLGWDTLTLLYGFDSENLPSEIKNIGMYLHLKKSDKYRKETIAQVSRLFGGKYVANFGIPRMVMLGDVDLIPMCDYWNPEPHRITCYGADLCGFKEFPMAYIAAPADIWQELIPENSIEELLDKYPGALSDDFYVWWSQDQRIITERILNHGGQRVIIRGHESSGLAKGRIDRAAWEKTLNIPNPIDCHCRRPFNKEDAELILSMVKA